MAKQIINSAFKAKQVAGSCRLSGINLSDVGLILIESIIQGESDGEAIQARLVSEYRRKNGISDNHGEWI